MKARSLNRSKRTGLYSSEQQTRCESLDLKQRRRRGGGWMLRLTYPWIPRILCTFTHGEMAEWFKAPVLKTGESQGSVSSNLTLSAMIKTVRKGGFAISY